MKTRLSLAACVLVLPVSASLLHAQTPPASDGGGLGEPVFIQSVAPPDAAKQPAKKRSPWLLLPIVSSGPKMGTSGGVLAAYLHYFDPKSDVSMFGVMYQYSTTDSSVGGLFARTSFGADHHRIEGVAGFGYVQNEYTDYEGTGQTVNTTDDLKLVAARYLYRLKGDWFVGAQALFCTYAVAGTNPSSQQILDLLGLSSINTGGLGVAVMHDSRDNQDMPVRGWYAIANNVADRESLGADANYATYRIEFKWFREHGKGHVFGVRQYDELTNNAPTTAETTVNMRGYKVMQYLGRYFSSLEAEERVRFSRRWGATLFGGVGRLYGGSSGPVNSDGYYPSYGAGVHFVVSPEDHMNLNFEFAHGNLNNFGIYLKLGYQW